MTRRLKLKMAAGRDETPAQENHHHQNTGRADDDNEASCEERVHSPEMRLGVVSAFHSSDSANQRDL